MNGTDNNLDLNHSHLWGNRNMSSCPAEKNLEDSSGSLCADTETSKTGAYGSRIYRYRKRANEEGSEDFDLNTSEGRGNYDRCYYRDNRKKLLRFTKEQRERDVAAEMLLKLRLLPIKHPCPLIPENTTPHISLNEENSELDPSRGV